MTDLSHKAMALACLLAWLPNRPRHPVRQPHRKHVREILAPSSLSFLPRDKGDAPAPAAPQVHMQACRRTNLGMWYGHSVCQGTSTKDQLKMGEGTVHMGKQKNPYPNPEGEQEWSSS